MNYQSILCGKNWLSVNETMPKKRDLVAQNKKIEILILVSR